MLNKPGVRREAPAEIKQVSRVRTTFYASASPAELARSDGKTSANKKQTDLKDYGGRCTA